MEVVKVVCNNDHCDQGQYMHRECFEAWEQTVLTYLRSCGRARSWSEKQRLQNLWTKRGYDLAFKACSCKCGKGHLRKDLDWIAPPVRHVGAVAVAAAVAQEDHNAAQAANNAAAAAAAAAAVAGGARNNGAAVAAAVPIPGNGTNSKKKKHKNKERPTLAMSAPVPHPNNNHQHHTNNTNANQTNSNTNYSTAPAVASCSTTISSHKNNYSSTSSSSSGFHPIGSVDSQKSLDIGLGHSLSSSLASRPRVNSLSSTGSAASSSGVSGSPPSPGAQFGSPTTNFGMNFGRFRKNSKGVMDMCAPRAR